MGDYIDDAVQSAALRLEIDEIGDHHFRCEILNDTASMVREIRTHDHATEAPTLGQLLYHFSLMTQQVETCDGYEDWAEEYEVDPQDPDTRKTYDQLLEDVTDLRALLGDDGFDQLQGALAIDQAMRNADPGR